MHTIETHTAEIAARADRGLCHAARLQERIASLERSLRIRDEIISQAADTHERSLESRRLLRQRLTAEIADVTRQRDEALAVCYAVEEWIHGRLTADQVQETWRNVYGRQPAEAAAG